MISQIKITLVKWFFSSKKFYSKKNFFYKKKIFKIINDKNNYLPIKNISKYQKK